jgi:hypothetical protein
MRRALLLLALAVAPAEAQTVSRYDSMTTLCEDLREKIRSEGAAIVRFSSKRTSNMDLYQRFVRDSRYCEYEERAKTTFIPTADTDSCRVFHCVVLDRDNSGPLTILPRQ